ncbi:MAG: WD40 repeat domain-containing protein, partial [Gemmataceae bacterium]
LLPAGHEYLVPLLPGGYLLTGERTGNPLQGRLWLRDMRTGANIQRFEGWMDGGSPSAVAAPGGRFVAVRGRAGELRVLDVQNLRCIYRCDPGGAASGLKLSANGEVLVWYRRVGKEIEVHMHHHAAKKTIVLRDLPRWDRVTFWLDNYSCLSPDGRWLLLPIELGRVRLWDTTTGKEASLLTEALARTEGITWSPDGRFVAVHGITMVGVFGPRRQSELRVWDAATGTRLPQLVLTDISWPSVLFTHDSRTIVTGKGPRIQLWEIATGQERFRLQGDLLSGIDSLALSADGRMLASGDHGSEALVWDLTGRMPDGQWRTTNNSPEQLRAAWATLASGDAKAAYRALWQLVADPDGAVAFLREQMRPIARPEPAQVARWIAALDSPEFAERERAERALEARGETVEVEMRRTLTQKPTLEVRRRIEALLEKLHGLPQGRQLQALRAIEVMEYINTSEARTLLRKLAAGASGARLTEEARQVLRRCQTRRTP